MQKRHRTDDFVEHYQRCGHHGTRLKLVRSGERGAGLNLVDEDCAAASHGLGSNSALLRKQSEADEALRQLTIGALSDEFVYRVPPPKINAADVDELTRGCAKELDQGSGVGAFSGLGRDPQKELLEALVRVGHRVAFSRNRIALNSSQDVSE